MAPRTPENSTGLAKPGQRVVAFLSPSLGLAGAGDGLARGHVEGDMVEALAGVVVAGLQLPLGVEARVALVGAAALGLAAEDMRARLVGEADGRLLGELSLPAAGQ